jgi:hypothetical protein
MIFYVLAPWIVCALYTSFENLGDIDFYNDYHDHLCISYMYNTHRVNDYGWRWHQDVGLSCVVGLFRKASPQPWNGPMQHSTLDADRGYEPKQEVATEGPAEVSLDQAFNKITEILRTLLERRALRGEDEALERFLKFQPPTFLVRQSRTRRLNNGRSKWKTSSKHCNTQRSKRWNLQPSDWEALLVTSVSESRKGGRARIKNGHGADSLRPSE